MPEIERNARVTRETLKEAWWSCTNAVLRMAFFLYIVAKPMAHYFEEVLRVGVTRYPWSLGDLAVPFVAVVVLYPIIPLLASLRCSISVKDHVLTIRTPFREVHVPFEQIREDIRLTNQRLYRRPRFFPMKNWFIVVPKQGNQHPINDPTYTVGPFWKQAELQETIEKINRVR